STDVWVNFKVFGLMGLTFMFMMTQVPMIQKYQIVPDDDEDGQTKN
ncbi:MAG: septation protein IspZ, partial [Pseudomonadota bacterium]|nr:septation protein IspZ [Pseudomonadota bacterium]